MTHGAPEHVATPVRRAADETFDGPSEAPAPPWVAPLASRDRPPLHRSAADVGAHRLQARFDAMVAGGPAANRKLALLLAEPRPLDDGFL